LFTTTQNAAEIIKHANKTDSDEFEFDEETRKKMMAIVEQAENKTKQRL
jgi:hypothetical protein